MGANLRVKLAGTVYMADKVLLVWKATDSRHTLSWERPQHVQ